MEKEPHNRVRNILLGVIGLLLLILGIVIGLIIASVISDRPLISESSGAETESMAAADSDETKADTDEPAETDTETAGQSSTEVQSSTETRESQNSTEIQDSTETQSSTEAQSDTAAQEDPIRIVLDPGHDDYCSRNHPDLGVNEQDLNLKIALACKAELETYEGVEVFLTREDGSCPDNGQGSDDVTGRTAYAASVDADLFVSLHNNATGLGYPSEANGAEVYITVYSKFTDESRKLGESILSELTSQVDLANRGVLTRVKAEKGYYDDGNVKDWYYLISTCIDQGFPGIIIEHAFMDNPHDNEILKDDSQLEAMGIADATGIARYYGLEKKSAQ